MTTRRIPTVRQLQAAAARAVTAEKAANAAFRAGLRDCDPAAYEALLRAFWAALDVANTDIFDERNRPLHDDIDLGDRDALVTALVYLEADATYFRSGYHKSALLRRLKRALLTGDDLASVSRIVDHALRPESRMPLRELATLARRLPRLPLCQHLMNVALTGMLPDARPISPLRAAVVLSRLLPANAPELPLVRAIIRRHSPRAAGRTAPA